MSKAVHASRLPAIIDELWEHRTELSPADEQARAAVVGAVDAIDAGEARVAVIDPATDEVVVDERAKRAILLAFRVLPMARSQVGDFRYDDRVPLTTRLDGVRALPGSIVRWGAYVAPGAVLMPSFVNIGAYVDSGTMVDTWATVGSGAQIGKNVHLSGGAGIGGVLEPPSAVPVVVCSGAVFAQAPLATRLAVVDPIVEDAIAQQQIPGAVLIVGHNGQVVYRTAYGSRALVPRREVMTLDTIFDRASLTKVVATTTALMQLWEQGKFRTTDPVAKHLPEFAQNGKQELPRPSKSTTRVTSRLA